MRLIDFLTQNNLDLQIEQQHEFRRDTEQRWQAFLNPLHAVGNGPSVQLAVADLVAKISGKRITLADKTGIDVPTLEWSHEQPFRAVMHSQFKASKEQPCNSPQ